MNRSRKGFTLIEMLVVIAIIAVLVSIVIPTVVSATDKAAAAADAANLRSILGHLNSLIMVNADVLEEIVVNLEAPVSNMHKDAQLHVLYTNPGFIEVYYVYDNAYYGLDYLSHVAIEGTSDVAVTKPTTGGTWYIVGQGPTGA